MSNGTTTIRDEPAGERRLDRRVVLGGTAAAAAGLVTRLTATNPAAARGERATIVLVHGAYAGGWIWRKVIPLLREAGHDVYATTATGMGDRVHLADPAINLDTYITDVVNVLKFEDLHEVTVVGWSFRGTIITGVAEQVPERLARLVYFDGNMPTDGQSNYDFLGRNDEFVGSQYRYGQEIGMPVAHKRPGRCGVVAGAPRAATDGHGEPANHAGQPGRHSPPSRLHLLHRREGDARGGSVGACGCGSEV